ncbi:MAG: SNF2-related protein [Blautia sp.]|nr:SNF2-related protein [Blautia sp.]
MARPFTAKEATQLIEQHRKYKNVFEKSEAISEQYRSEIASAADYLATQEVLRILKDIPMEEINRDKRGFRTKALRDHGYHTIADIATASVYHIASVKGISEDTAYSIKRVADDLVRQARKNVKIRLSADNRNPSATRLVSAVSKYRKSAAHIAACKRLLSSEGEKIENALKDLMPTVNSFKWLFTSNAKKQKAQEAYNMLLSLLSGTYGRESQNAVRALYSVHKMTDNDAWTDFSANSIQFFNILENVAPGILGIDDDVYGLPEDLAREIQDECFFPKGLLCELRRYQEWGVKYILHQERVLLGDEMGLGKTIQAIAAMVSLKNTGATHFAVVCPASVIANWCREIRKHSLLRVIKVHGQGRKAALQEWISTGGVAVTTYETTGYFTLEKVFRFTLLVVDEAHYIKNPEARRTMNVKELGDHADRLLFMTGTALENKVNEMVSLIQILQPEVAFQVRNMLSLASAPQFRTKVAPVYYRRKREDVLTELPELIETREWCTMSYEETQVYRQSLWENNYANVRRVSWNIDDLKKSSKAARMLEIIEEAKGEGRKVLVFSFFLDTIRKITLLLGSRCLNPINGSVSPQRRQEIIDEFDQAPAGTVLAAQIQSGGTGLNIQSASVVILCEPQFKPSIENQAVSRAYRMGQTRNVLVYRLLCEDTVDEKITALLEQKQRLFDEFADQSAAAKESLELDDKTFGNMIKEEIERINAKNR